MKYVVAFLAVAGLGLIGCGSSGADCQAAADGYAKCYASGADSWKTACEAENDAGLCSRAAYWECYSTNECADTNDTDTLSKISTCLTDNVGCE